MNVEQIVDSAPPDWERTPLWSVARRIERRGHPTLRRLSVYRDYGVIPTDSRDDNFNKPGEDADAYKLVRTGDLVLNKMKTWQGSLGVSEFEGTVSPAYYVCEVAPRVHSRWLHYLLRSKPYVALYGARSKGIRPNQWDLPYDEFRNVPVLLPPSDEQRRIADYLDTETARIDALIEKKRKQSNLIAERTERRAEVAALPGLDNSMRETPLDVPLVSEVPAGWSTPAIGSLLQLITYGFTNPMPTADDGPYMLTANDIGDGAIRYDDARRTSMEAYRSLLTEKSRPKKGDVLLTKDGSLGRVALHDGRMACINQSVALLRPFQRAVLPELLVELLRVAVYRDALIFNAGGTTIKHLYITRVVKQRLALPTCEQGQQALLADLRNIQDDGWALRSVIDRQVGLLSEHRQALITAAVTGEFEVPGASA